MRVNSRIGRGLVVAVAPVSSRSARVQITPSSSSSGSLPQARHQLRPVRCIVYLESLQSAIPNGAKITSASQLWRHRWRRNCGCEVQPRPGPSSLRWQMGESSTQTAFVEPQRRIVAEGACLRPHMVTGRSFSKQEPAVTPREVGKVAARATNELRRSQPSTSRSAMCGSCSSTTPPQQTSAPRILAGLAGREMQCLSHGR